MVTLKTLCEELASLSGWDIAERLGCHYSGDSNPIEHGGYFYNLDNWEKYGYADCVEFWIDPDSPKVYGCPNTLCVTIGTINKPDDMSDALESLSLEECERIDIHAQIDACRWHYGIEPDDYTPTRTYRLHEWKEWRIWKSLLPLLQSLKCSE